MFPSKVTKQVFPSKVPKKRFPSKGSKNRLPSKGSKNRLPGTGSQASSQRGSQARHPGIGSQARLPRKGSQAKLPGPDLQARCPGTGFQAKFILFQRCHAHYSSFVWGHCCVFKHAHLKTETANNFLNWQSNRIDNQRRTSASSQAWLRQTCDNFFLWLFLLGIFFGLLLQRLIVAKHLQSARPFAWPKDHLAATNSRAQTSTLQQGMSSNTSRIINIKIPNHANCKKNCGREHLAYRCCKANTAAASCGRMPLAWNRWKRARECTIGTSNVEICLKNALDA